MRTLVRGLFVLLLIASAVPPAHAGPPNETGVLRVLTLNVAHGRGAASRPDFLPVARIRWNLRRVATVLRRADAHVVALQEADGPSAWSGRFDHVAALGELAGLPHRFRGTHATGNVWSAALDYGTALLSALPLEEARSRPFTPSVWGSKGYVVATVTVPGTLRRVDVVSVHLDFADPQVRRRQIDTMVADLAGRDRPLVILGDLNCGFEAACVGELARRLDLRAHAPTERRATFPASDPEVRIDWILASRSFEFASYRTLRHQISDHRAVLAELRLRQPDTEGSGRYQPDIEKSE